MQFYPVHVYMKVCVIVLKESHSLVNFCMSATLMTQDFSGTSYLKQFIRKDDYLCGSSLGIF